MTTQSTTTRLTPSASIREQYYRKHGIQQRSTSNLNPSSNHLDNVTSQQQQPLKDEGEDSDNLFDYRPEGAIAFAPLKLPDFPSINADDISLLSRQTEYDDTEDDDAATRSIISLQTMDSLAIGNNDSGHSTLASSSGINSGHPLAAPAPPPPRSLFGQPKSSSRNFLRRQQSSQTLFASSSSTMDPKWPPQQQVASSKASTTNEKASLLSRLSKTTAPMRARLSAMSRTSSKWMMNLKVGN